MCRFEKRRTKTIAEIWNPARAHTDYRTILMFGAVLTVICPAAISEDHPQSFEPLEPANGASSLATISGDRSKTSGDISAPIEVTDKNVIIEPQSRLTPTLYSKVSFIPVGTPAPPSTAANRDEPSRFDQFNEKLSRVVTVELAATFGGQSLGTLPTETTLSKVLKVEARALYTALAPLVDDSTKLLLSQFKSGFVSVERLEAIGVTISLNTSTLTLEIVAPAKTNSFLDLSLGGRNVPEGLENSSAANIAAGLTSTILVNENFGGDRGASVSGAFSGFFNLGGVRGLNLDYGGTLQIDDGTGRSRFDADRTVLFLDRPEHALRFEAGTLFAPLSEIAGEGDFLGVGVTKSYRQLQPTRVLQPLGQRSFQISRPSEVTVLVDGQPVSRFDAPAGAVNLRDIPLAGISNNVTIIVEDEFGRRETEDFSVASDAFLLERGLSEFSFGVGSERDRTRGNFSYSSKMIAAGNFQYGVASNLTVGGFGYLSDEQSVVGSQAVFAALNGIARVEAGYSDSANLGGGTAVSVDYRWASPVSARKAQNFAIALDYRDPTFAMTGSKSGAGTKYEASAFYERQLSDRLRINISGSYSEDYVSNSTSENISIGSSWQLGNFFLGGGVRVGSVSGQDDKVGAFLTLRRRLGQTSSISARYDTQNDRGSLRYRRPSRNEVGSFGVQSELNSREQELSLRGAIDYTANRYRTRLSVTQGSEQAQLDGSTALSARFQTGIAFADGKFGIGRDPGRGFVMVDRHESLSDARVQIRSRGREGLRASSGLLGPAVARINSPYVPTTTRIDVTNAPIGYNVGAGAYYSIPGARSGIKITVGTDAYRNVLATFVLNGEPLALAAGKLVNLDTGKTQVTFTNSGGRALLADLKPGSYQLVFTETNSKFEFQINADSAAFTNLGEIQLEAGETK